MRFPETCRGRRAWHASKESCRNWEALPPPEAPTAGAKRDRRFNDKKTSPRVSKSRESDRSIVVRGQASAAPTRSKGPAERRNPQREPAPGNGKLRPLAIPTLEEKLVQSAAAQIFSAIYRG